MNWPSPVASRCRSAASTAVEAYRPVRMSTMLAPTFIGSSGCPETLIIPDMAWKMPS